MICKNCHSTSLIRFVDFKGMKRVYCRYCRDSYIILTSSPRSSFEKAGG